MVPGINNVQPSGQYAHHRAPGHERSPDGGRVNALGHTGHHHSAAVGQLHGQLSRHPLPVRGTAAGAHHGNGHLVVQRDGASLGVEHQGRLGDVLQALGIHRILTDHHPDAQLVAAVQNPLHLSHGLVLERGSGQTAEPGEFIHVLGMGVVYPLRPAEVVQHPLHSDPRQASPGGQPHPVFQVGHRSPPPSLSFIIGLWPSPRAPPTPQRRR